jgi:hypothetical protein
MSIFLEFDIPPVEFGKAFFVLRDQAMSIDMRFESPSKRQRGHRSTCCVPLEVCMVSMALYAGATGNQFILTLACSPRF